MSRHTVYLRRLLLGRYLIVTNTVSAGTLDGLADAVEQCGVESIQPHDWPRTLRMGTTGLLLGPVDHCWYRFLDSRFPGSHAAAVAKKVALDSLMYLPVGIVLFYTRELQPLRVLHSVVWGSSFHYTVMCKLEGKSWREAAAETKQKFSTTVEAS